MSAATLTADPATEFTESPHRTVWQTIDERFSLEIEALPHDMYRAILWDSRPENGKGKQRHAALNWSLPSVIRKLKENILDESDFATDAEKEAAEKIEVPE